MELSRRGVAGVVSAACLALWCSAAAADEPEPVHDAPAQVAQVAQEDVDTATSSDDLPLVEGAIGAVLSYGPEIPGSAQYGSSWSPIGYIRYGRITVSKGAGGLVNRRSDDLLTGLGLNLVDQERRRISVSLRLDRGRDESASRALRGLGSVPTTVRVRAVGTWQFDGGWRTSLSWTVDAFNRGGGNLADLNLGYERHVAPRTVWTASARLAVGGPRYMQTYYGVDQAQSQSSGYPVYEPGLGLRDLQLGLGLRTDLGPHWSAQAGLNLMRLLGPAARSPIVQQVNGFGASAGLAWRF
jgi:MipA family protein